MNDVNVLLSIKKDLEDIDSGLDNNYLVLDQLLESINILGDEKGIKKEGQKRDVT
jgi:hypothetical protein